MKATAFVSTLEEERFAGRIVLAKRENGNYLHTRKPQYSSRLVARGRTSGACRCDIGWRVWQRRSRSGACWFRAARVSYRWASPTCPQAFGCPDPWCVAGGSMPAVQMNCWRCGREAGRVRRQLSNTRGLVREKMAVVKNGVRMCERLCDCLTRPKVKRHEGGLQVRGGLGTFCGEAWRLSRLVWWLVRSEVGGPNRGKGSEI